MNLTLYDLELIKKNCDNLSKLVTELKNTYNPQSYERKLFVSREDYKESLRLKNQCPQDFYFLRCFDSFVQVVYNSKTKFYQIYVENFYCKELNAYERLQRSSNSYVISQDFDVTLRVFKTVCKALMNEKLDNELFESD